MRRWPIALTRFIVHRRTRYVLCWMFALGLTGWQSYFAWHAFDSPRTDKPAENRRDANYGHALVDFGGQWLLGHMVACGRGHDLYVRSVQIEMLEAGYPRSDEAPSAKEHDAGQMVIIDVPPLEPGGPALSGPLYPPTCAVMFSPLGRLPPRQAYRTAQVFFLAMTWIAGLAISGISRGRFWWPAATMFVMIFLGYAAALQLGQNSVFSLTILLAGWWFVSYGWEIAGGIVWGLLAYKPVWAAAFLLVPLLTRRWRMVVAMIATGLALVLATLPIVGIESWMRWLRVGQSAADLYKVDDNWVFLSRDMLGIPRRWLLNFDVARDQRDRFVAGIAGWALWAGVLAATAIVAMRRRRDVDQIDGYGAAFVALGAWATCFHFIYYDSLLAVFPLTLLLTEPGRFLRLTMLTASPPPPELADFYAPHTIAEIPRSGVVPASAWTTAVLNSFVLTCVALLIGIEQGINNVDLHASVSIGGLPSQIGLPQPLKIGSGQAGTPWDTFVLLVLWVYCGARVLMGSVGGAHPTRRPTP